MFSRHSVILVTISSLTQLVYESVLKVLMNNSFFFLHFVIKVYSHQRNVILSYFYILQFVETFFVTNILLILKNILRFLRMGIWKEFIFSSLILLYLVYFISSIKYSLLICCFLSDTFLLNLICYNPGEVNYLLSPVLFCLFFYYLYYLLYECLCYYWGPEQASPRYPTMACWLFRTKITWEAAEKGGAFWLFSALLKAERKSSM